MRAYQSLRQAGKEICGKLLKVIPRDVLVSTAQELGLWKSGVLVGDAGDTDILADRMIYDRRWHGRICVEHFEAKNAGIGPSEGEGRFLAAMWETNASPLRTAGWTIGTLLGGERFGRRALGTGRHQSHR
jgi:hypothetical protein